MADETAEWTNTISLDKTKRNKNCNDFFINCNDHKGNVFFMWFGKTNNCFSEISIVTEFLDCMFPKRNNGTHKIPFLVKIRCNGL